MIDFIKKIFKKYIGESSYKKNIMIMTVGRVLSQVIPILLTPILTRIYSPEEFGIFAVYNTVITILALISGGRYCLAILLPEEDEDAKNLVVISSSLTILSTILFTIIFLIFKAPLFNILDSSILQNYIWVIIIGLLFISLHEILFYYGLRLKEYKTLAIDVTVYSLLVLIIRLILGYTGNTTVGLCIAYALGYAFSFFFLFFRLSILKKFKDIKIKLPNIKLLLAKYSKFPKFSLFADTLNMFAYMSPNLLLNKIFGSAEAGYFAMSDKVLGTPIWLITMSVGDVFKQEAAEQYRKNHNCKDIYNKTAKALFLFGIIPFVLLFVVSPSLFPIIFGANWEPVGLYIRIFSLMYFARFVINPVSNIVYIVNKQSYNILFQFLKIFALVIAFTLGSLLRNITLGLIIWSGLTTISYLVIFLISKRLAEGTESE